MNGRSSAIHLPLGPGLAALFLLAFSLLLPHSASQAARRPVKAPSTDSNRAGGEHNVQGFIDSTGPGYLFVDGLRYDTTRAIFVAPGGKKGTATVAQRGSRVSMTLRGGQVVVIYVFDPASLE